MPTAYSSSAIQWITSTGERMKLVEWCSSRFGCEEFVGHLSEGSSRLTNSCAPAMHQVYFTGMG